MPGSAKTTQATQAQNAKGAEKRQRSRPRKKHTQAEMVFKTHGGKRAGAGRPPTGKRSSEPHKRRAEHDGRFPLHVTIRVADDVPNLRRRDLYMALREATITVAKRDDFRIVHMSIQGNHVHLIIEAENKTALSKGMQGFQISAAKHINAALIARGVKRSGSVFLDHYHSRELTSPKAVRHALAYVLNNWRRHDEDATPTTKRWKLDPFSSAVQFGGWKELGDSPFMYDAPSTYQALVVWRPRTWLLRKGWARHSDSISVYEVPGPASPARRKR